MTLKSVGILSVGLALGLALSPYSKILPVSADEKGPARRANIQNGDVNGNSEIDVADVVHLLHFLFLSGPAPTPIECDDPPPGVPAKFRFRIDPTCAQTPVAGTVEMCGVVLQDSSGDSRPSAFGEFRVPASGACDVVVSSFHPTCGWIAICGSIPVREGHCYSLVLEVVGNAPQLWYYEQTERADGSCPPFPPDNSPPTGSLLGSFTQTCAGKGGSGGGWESSES